MQQNAGRCIKEIQGYPERVQCLAQAGSTVWCGSAYGSIAVHDAQVFFTYFLIIFFTN